MYFDIPWLGVILATLSAFVVGSIWYMPKTFMPAWQKMTGTSDEAVKATFPSAMAWIGVVSLILAYVLALAIGYYRQATGITGLTAGIEVSLVLWLGVSLSTVVAGGAMESRSRTLLLIQAGNRLATLLVMGLILGAFM